MRALKYTFPVAALLISEFFTPNESFFKTTVISVLIIILVTLSWIGMDMCYFLNKKGEQE